MIMAPATSRHAMPYTFAKSGESMTRSHTAIAPWLLIPGLAFAVIAGAAPAEASTAPGRTAVLSTATSGGGMIDTNLSGPPADPSMVFTGTVNQPLAGSLPGSSAAIGVSFTVTNATMLPPGLRIGSSGTVTGIPTADGIYTAGVTACDTLGCTPGSVTFTIAPDQAPCDNQPGLPSTGSAAVALSLGAIRVTT
jgi:hypothetical protein